MDVQQLLLSPHGRIRRKTFWITFILLNIISGFAAFLIAAFIAVVSQGTIQAANIATPIASLAVSYPGLCIYAKRLHDLGKSGWWQVLSWLPSLLVLPASLMGSLPAGVDVSVFGWAVIATVTVALGQFGYLGFVRGDPDRNRFGLPEGISESATADIFA